MRKLRSDKFYDLRSAIFQVIENVVVQKGDMFGSCITCFHFDEKNEQCKLYKQRPPARVIAYGCPSYEDDEIPF